MSTLPALPRKTARHVYEHCLCLAAQRAARTLARRFDEAFRPLGITSWQFSLLMSLNREAPPSVGAIASTLGMDRTTLTANLKPLERRGLVQTSIDPEDRRGRRVTLTAAGGKLLRAALPIWRRTHAAIDATLPEDHAKVLRSSLRAMT
jgi:DNA-binding MarR family transcriptional regulator